MIIIKKKFTVEIEVLSIDAVPAILVDVANQIRNENVNGKIGMEDGDTATWNMKTEEIEI